MIGRILLPLILAGLLADVSAQEGARFHFETGEPAWKGERIQLPPGFAPDMKWIGVEDIRFAPGMFQADSDSFFTYALVFLLEKDAETSPAAIKRELLAYYRGLSRTVMKGKEKDVDTTPFKIDLKKEANAKSPPAGVESVTSFSGTLDWIEPFATLTAQKLHFEVQLWKNGDQPALFLCVSPKERTAEIWNLLREIRSKFRIETGQ